jgi:hypothetical protein
MLAGKIALATASALEGGACIARLSRRSSYYARAQAAATATGRPLVVIGDPNAGAATRILPTAGSGDVCIDLTGCPTAPRGITADITKGVPQVADNSAIVYVSCVFEYVDDVQAAWAEALRMAGDASRVYVVTVEPWTFTAAIYPHARWAILSAPPDGPFLARPITTARKALSWAAIGAMGLWAVK